MAASIAERLERRRASMFVGRAAELAAIGRLLDPNGDRRFLYVTGPGGIGKTELLHAAAREAAVHGRRVVRIDGRSRTWTAGELAAAMTEATAGSPALVLLDSFEAVAHLESLLRTESLPALPDHARVAGAGRVPLASSWREDSGWSQLLEVVAPGTLSVSESEELLVRRGVPADRARRYAVEIPGHPLTIALLGEILARDSGASPRIEQHQNVARTLVDRLLGDLPLASRRLLEAASIVRVLTEPMLASLLDRHEVHDDLEQLRGWSFVDAGESGLSVHDVVRSAVASELAARDRARFATLFSRAARHLEGAWRPDIDRKERARLVRDFFGNLFGHMQRHLAPQNRDDLEVVPVWPEAWPAIESMVTRFEGPESLAALRYWRELGATVVVCTDEHSRVLGFQSVISLERYSEAQAARDPGTLPLWRRWRDAGVLRAGQARLIRHWMAAETYQDLSSVQSGFFVHIAELMTASDTAGMAQTFADVAAYDAFATEWTPRHLPEVDFICDGRRYGCMVRDYLEVSAAEVVRRIVAISAEQWEQMARAPAAGSIADRLRDRRAAMFVGREPELAAIRRLLAADGELRLIHVWGPGGIGKTELLHAAAREAEALGWQVTRIDARDRAWTAATLGAELVRATQAPPALVLLDHFEVIAHLDEALRTECMPKLPDTARVVVAGRIRPSSAWREDVAWSSRVEAMLIHPLGLDDRKRLLELRGVGSARARQAAVAIPGHPLTLALFAHTLSSDLGGDARFDQDRVVVEALVERLLTILSPSAREVIEAAALAYPVDERALQVMLARDVSQGDFAELARCGLLERAGEALELHDLVRIAVRADLSGRDAQRRALLLHRLAAFTLDHVPIAGGADALEWARAIIHLLSQAQYIPVDLRGDLYIAPMWPEAWPEVAAMVDRHEGPESLAALRHWRNAGAEMLVSTSDEGAVLGFMSVLALDQVSRERAERDPGVRPLWRYWHDAGVLSSGRAHLVRHWMAAESHQAMSPVQATVFMRITEMLSRGEVAGMAQAFRDATWIRGYVTEMSPQLVPGTEFRCDGIDHVCLVASYLERSAIESLRQQPRTSTPTGRCSRPVPIRPPMGREPARTQPRTVPPSTATPSAAPCAKRSDSATALTSCARARWSGPAGSPAASRPRRCARSADQRAHAIESEPLEVESQPRTVTYGGQVIFTDGTEWGRRERRSRRSPLSVAGPTR